MARPMWTGSISFGLVNVPVKLYNAVRKKTINFHQLHAADGARIRLKRVCSVDGKEVAAENIVKGYEISPDRYVIIKPEELAAISPKASRSIEIEDFVELEQIDPIYFQHSYYLEPDKGSAKAYSLLRAAMKNTHKVAIARFVLRDKEYLAAIRPAGRALTLETMYFADEVLDQAELEALPEEQTELNKKELAMAEQLIASLSTDFDPAKYHDQHREQVMELIERKAEGQDVVEQPRADEGAKVIDLMSALEASLNAIKKKQPAKERRKKARA